MEIKWSISESGKLRLREEIDSYGNGERELSSHINNNSFTNQIAGLSWIQHICTKTNHGVLLVEGMLFDSESFDSERPINDIVESGWKGVKEVGLRTLLMCHEYLINYIDDVQSFREWYCVSENPTFKIVNFDDLFKSR